MAQDTETTVMGRIREEIEVDGRKCWTLFDSGAQNSYITRDAASELIVRTLPQSRQIKLGGANHQITETCIVVADVSGHSLDFQAWVIDEIGRDENGRQIDVLFGALAMQLWNIRLDMRNERLDLSRSSTDFVEF